MADGTAIEWTDATWNPIGGCSIKSPGCVPCYAQKLAGTRLKHHPLYAGTTTLVKGKPVFNGHLTAAPDDHPVWTWPLRWRGAKNPRLGPGKPSLIFVGDMSDLFHEDRPEAQTDRGIRAIVYSRHIGQLLTKRPERMLAYFADQAATSRCGFDVALFDPVFTQRLWLGTSAERQREFDERWPFLRELAKMGFTVFISYEPAIGPLVLPDDFLALGNRAWVIAGGMSGNDADQPMHPAWPRAMRDQCAAAGVPFFFKQWGHWLPFGQSGFTQWSAAKRSAAAQRRKWLGHAHFNDGAGGPEHLMTGRLLTRYATTSGESSGHLCVAIGKSRSGRLFDGVEHNAFPGGA